MRTLTDIVAEAIRNDGDGMREKPWAELSEGNRLGWYGDANRAIAAMGSELADILQVALAAKAFVDDLPMDDAGERYVIDINNGSDLQDLVHHTINLTEASTDRLLSALCAAKDFEAHRAKPIT